MPLRGRVLSFSSRITRVALVEALTWFRWQILTITAVLVHNLLEPRLLKVRLSLVVLLLRFLHLQRPPHPIRGKSVLPPLEGPSWEDWLPYSFWAPCLFFSFTRTFQQNHTDFSTATTAINANRLCLRPNSHLFQPILLVNWHLTGGFLNIPCHLSGQPSRQPLRVVTISHLTQFLVEL